MAESLELQIESDTRGAVKSIGNLETKLGSLGQTLSSINTSNLHSFSSGLKELSVSMGSLSKIDTRTFTKVAKNIKKFEEIDSGKISQLSSTLAPLTQGLSAFSSTSFDNKSLTSFINSFTRLANSNISGLASVNFTDLGNRISGLASALSNSANVDKNTIQVVNAVSNLAKAGNKAQATATSLPLLGSNLRSLISSLSTASIVSDNTIQFASALGVLASAGNRTAQTASNLGLLATELKKFMQVMSTAPTVSANIIQMTNALANLANAGSKAGSASKSLTSGFSGFSGIFNHTSKASKGFGGLTSAIGKFYAKWFLVIRAIKKLGSFVDLSSQLTEVQNVVDTTFGDMTSKVDDFVDISIEKFGMSELTAKQIASRFQAMGTAVGISASQVASGSSVINSALEGQEDTLYSTTNSMADMSLNLTKLAADMASFYDVDQEDVAKSLESVFTGTTAPLRQYGLDITQATLKEWAMKQGIDADVQSMTQAEKVMLRYQYVMANTTAAQGDFAKTADTWANSVRTLKQEFEAWGSIIGKVIINAFKPFVVALKKAMVYVIQFTQTVADALGAIFGWTIEVSSAGVADDSIGDVSDSLDDVGSSADSANSSAKALKKTLLSIDEIHALDDNSSSSSGSGSGSGSGSTGTSGSGLSATTKQVDGLVEKYKSSIKDLYELGSYIGDAITNSLNSIDWIKVYQGAKNFGKGLADFLNGLISPELFGAVSKTIANSLNTALYFLNTFGETFDWTDFGNSIASGINNFFSHFNFSLAASTINTWSHGILTSLTTAIEGVDWEKVGDSIGTFFSEIDWEQVAWDLFDLAEAIGEALKDALGSWFEKDPLSATIVAGFGLMKLTGLDTVIAKKISEKLGGALAAKLGVDLGSKSGIGAAIVGGLSKAVSTVKTNIGLLFEGLFSGLSFGDAFTFAFGTAATGIVGALSTVGGAILSVVNFVKMLKDGFSWLNEILMVVGIALTTVGAILLGVAALPAVIAGAVVAAVATIVVVVKDHWEEIKSLWNEHVAPWFTKEKWEGLWDGAKEGAKSKWNEIAEWWNNTAIYNWWNDDVAPWFTKEKWEELGDNIKEGIKTKWGEFTEWWQNTGIYNWWTNNVAPWFTKEKWQNLGANVKEGIQTKWNEFTEWWKNTGIYKWWNEHVAPWFTKAKWQEFGSNIKEGIKSKWNEFTEWWNNTSFAKWWSGVKEKFSKDSWSFSGIKEGLSSAWDSAIEAIKGTWNNFATWLNKKLTLNIDTSTTIGKAVKTALGTSTITLGKIPTFRTGGFPDGENGLFYANSNELVGKFSNGKTAVANNDQITDGIRQAVVEGMMEVFMATNSNSSPNESGAPIIENIVKVDSETLYRITQQGKAVHDQRFNVITEIG